jgi:hypothetical protein
MLHKKTAKENISVEFKKTMAEDLFTAGNLRNLESEFKGTFFSHVTCVL